jgi:hypothetical protein
MRTCAWAWALESSSRLFLCILPNTTVSSWFFYEHVALNRAHPTADDAKRLKTENGWIKPEVKEEGTQQAQQAALPGQQGDALAWQDVGGGGEGEEEGLDWEDA